MYSFSYKMVVIFPGQLELAEIFGDFNVLDKYFAMLIDEIIFPLLFDFREGISDKFPEIQEHLGKGYGFYFGFGSEGIMNRVQWPDMTASFFPPLPAESKFNPEFVQKSENLPSDYATFFDHFDQVVLVAFGTTFMPNEETLELIVETAILQMIHAQNNPKDKKIGFIISLKEKYPMH